MARAARICGVHGCPAPVAVRGRCLRHALPDRRRLLQRDPDQVRFYRSAEWRTLRAAVIAEEPVCRLCCEAPTKVVDHIDGNWQNNSRGNLRGLCGPCERRRTARQHAQKALAHRPTPGGGRHFERAERGPAALGGFLCVQDRRSAAPDSRTALVFG